MIPSKELRIGNWAIDTGDGNFYKIPSGLSINNSHLLDPIPLNSDILEKAGFEFITDWTIKGNDGVVYRKDLGWLRLETGMMGYTICLVDKQGVSTGVHASNLHQLENLYFALTGEELNIQL